VGVVTGLVTACVSADPPFMQDIFYARRHINMHTGRIAATNS
jgi:hypothetical protein